MKEEYKKDGPYPCPGCGTPAIDATSFEDASKGNKIWLWGLHESHCTNQKEWGKVFYSKMLGVI